MTEHDTILMKDENILCILYIAYYQVENNKASQGLYELMMILLDLHRFYHNDLERFEELGYAKRIY